MAAKKQKPEEKEPIRPTKLYRSETNKVIAGVAGGIGEYFNVDPTIIRIIFIVITLLHGFGLLLYIILWLVIPKETHQDMLTNETVKLNAEEMRERAAKFTEEFRLNSKDKRRLWIGIIILVLGLFALLNNFGFYSLDFGIVWPIILIIFGIALLFKL